jgi:iron complex transport system ATP-binding protein
VVSALRASGLVHKYPGGRRALDGVDLALEAGELVTVIGPNGSGKSTLLRLCAGLLTPAAGAVALAGRDVPRMSARERARALAFVPQGLRALPELSASAFVRGGRYAHQPRLANVLARESAADRAAVARAREGADASDLAARRLDELSLGQFQRVLLARALAQEAPLLLLDEPTAALDPEHQVRSFLLIERLVASGRAALVVTHELSLASRFAGRCVVLRAGRVAAAGAPAAVFRPEVLEPVFGPHLHYASVPAAPGEARPLVVPWPAGSYSPPPMGPRSSTA